MEPYNLGRVHKLKSPKSFGLLFSKSKPIDQINGQLLLLKYHILPNGASTAKYGLAVSKRLFARAVDRNYIKRRLSEAVRLNQEDVFETSGLEFVLIYRDRKKRSFSEIEKAVNLLLTELAIACKHTSNQISKVQE